MSYRHPDGLRAEPPRTVAESNRLLTDLYREWSGHNPRRLRCLAAVVLHGEGWTHEMIARALGWANRGAAHKAIDQTRRDLQQHFARLNPGAAIANDGFSDPDRP